ncbi:FAD/NAD(P)-binding domain-containing protein [Patellaria atrata CBS 101060]|uniref:FAD/NAD(P)-binding domain-containing protein n=1 Tax=Patellaria atrata CBS 101060 TaxID=1346257 RepID=A0A9P4VTR7_9PEZI|nr:FAD/NAD(P)-binding domain-containing protein [Patellaria atrata CBS 101060]
MHVSWIYLAVLGTGLLETSGSLHYQGHRYIKVTLLDCSDTIDSRPRAAHYAPSAVRELARAGVLEDVRAQGFIPGNMCWRRVDGSKIVEWNDSSQVNNPEALTVLHIAHLLAVLLDHAQKNPNVDLRWKHTVTDVKQDETSATAVVRKEDGSEIQMSGDYVVGCDGGASRVRKTLFGNKFEGHTWDAQLIATNVYYPGFEKHGYNDINFIIDPEHYYMAARITRDGLWRVSFGVDRLLDLDEVKEIQPKKYEVMLPGNPKPNDYKLVSLYPYRIHQRCAEKFRVGRVLLAADAAHVCNPFGGMGLTGGIVDVGGLADCLVGVAKGLADEGILDVYDEQRRRLWHEVINPVSTNNYLRVSSKDVEKTGREDEALNMFRRANEDSEYKKEVDEGAYAICYDFTKHYLQRADSALETTA